MDHGRVIEDYILSRYNKSVKAFAEDFDNENRGGYLFLNKVVKRKKLTANDRQRLKSDFGIDVNEVFSNTTITDSNVANNGSSIQVGNQNEKVLKAKIEGLEKEIEALKETIALQKQMIDLLKSK